MSPAVSPPTPARTPRGTMLAIVPFMTAVLGISLALNACALTTTGLVHRLGPIPSASLP